ncbi:MAG TPA: phytoene desaturase family protein [Acidimicrobiia bacterium]|nr:phytoene desaturase family protein [Acidimicrobiia bacterium]
MRVVVVGAGLGGLAASCHLAGRGHDVVVFERDTEPGGVAGRLEGGGYRIDTGPAVLTMLGILDDTFRAAGATLDEHLTVQPLDPMYRACFADGSELHVRAGTEAMAGEIEDFAGSGAAEGFRRFSAWLRDLYEAEFGSFINRNFDSPLGLARRPGDLARLVRLGALGRLAPKVASFFDDERLQRVFSFQALYAGLSPFDALAVFSIITYMDTVEGVSFPSGGMHEVARGLAAAAEKAGASFAYASPVERIDRGADGVVSGVRLATGERVAADAVVCNADVAATYRTLLGLAAPRRVSHGRYSPSCALWLAGVRGSPPPGAAHHNLHFGRPWRAAFDTLLRDGRRMPDPSILVTAASVTDPSLAPAGGTTLYVLEPVPNLDGAVAWDTAEEETQADLRARVGALGYPVDDIELEAFIGPPGWAARGLERGTPFALAHQFFQSGPFRTPNIDRRIPGLVLVGMGTVPGVGIPMVLLSGRLAADRVERWGGS